jgi:hypothetical protein
LDEQVLEWKVTHLRYETFVRIGVEEFAAKGFLNISMVEAHFGFLKIYRAVYAHNDGEAGTGGEFVSTQI